MARGSSIAVPARRKRHEAYRPPPTMGMAARQATPRGGEKTVMPTSMTADVTTEATRGEYMCAKISPSTMSSRETRRDVFPAVSGPKEPSGKDATLSPMARCMFVRKSKATE